MKDKIFLVLFVLVLLIVACSPSPEAIQEAIAQTQAAEVTNNNTPEPTFTFTLEPTFTSTATNTFTPTLTQTLTSTPDTRVITIDSKELMLTKEDLPPEAKYYLPNSGWISPHHNSEIISGWGVEEGAKYLEETGRIDGWWVYYRRGTSTVRAPEQIYQNIIQYKTAEGAYFTFSNYSFDTNNPDFSLFNTDVDVDTVLKVKRKNRTERHNEDQTVIDFLERHTQYEVTCALRQQRSPFCETLSQPSCCSNLLSPDYDSKPQ